METLLVEFAEFKKRESTLGDFRQKRIHLSPVISKKKRKKEKRKKKETLAMKQMRTCVKLVAVVT